MISFWNACEVPFITNGSHIFTLGWEQALIHNHFSSSRTVILEIYQMLFIFFFKNYISLEILHRLNYPFLVLLENLFRAPFHYIFHIKVQSFFFGQLYYFLASLSILSIIFLDTKNFVWAILHSTFQKLHKPVENLLIATICYWSALQ